MAMERLLTGVQTTKLHNITHGPVGEGPGKLMN